MKLNRLLFLSAFLLFSFFADAQPPPGMHFEGFQGGTSEIRDEITPEQRQRIYKTIQDNIVMLAKKGITAESMVKRGPITTKFGWPLRQAAGFNDPSYYSIMFYVDVDTTTGAFKDYNCGTRTYDGHMGTDILTVPFWWEKMEENAVEIVAAADGIIVAKSSLNEDKVCVNCPEDAPESCFHWNCVYVQHADGTIAFYGHMKKNSPTSKAVGETVTKGEYLGIVGSSGNSAQPHLHFEVWENDEFTHLLLPWEGSCNTDKNASMWEAQQPYYKPEIIEILSGTAPVEVKFCWDGSPEKTYEKKEFTIGETVYLTSFIRDHLDTGPDYEIKLSDPNKKEYKWTLPATTWTGHYPWLYFNYYYDQRTFNIPGVWKYSIKYGDSFQEISFKMNSPAPLNLLSFSAKSVDENVLLNWQTTDESNTSHFEIEHGTDADNFTIIGNISTVGNERSGKNEYSLNDNNPAPGMNFYRLKMVDKDGKFNYSKIEKVNVVKRNAVKVFPNPATNIVTLQGVKNYSRVRISNLQGNVIMTKSFEGDELKLNISHLPAGVYLLQLGKEVFDYNVKLIKK